jgi:hypothetical protein
MNSQDYILYYFAFGMLHDMFNVNYANQLLGGNGKLTDLGWKYVQCEYSLLLIPIWPAR